MSRYGTPADAVFVGGSIDSILSLTDSVPKNDVRVCFFLKGTEPDDGDGRYYRITAPAAEPDDAVGMCITSAEEGTDLTDSDLDIFHENFDEGIFLVVDPYACEFSVYKVKGYDYAKAQILISE